MRHTLKADFDHRSDARQALDGLRAAGYTPGDIALSSAAGFTRFMRRRHVITLEAGSEEEARCALGIIECHRPVGIEDRVDAPNPDSAVAGPPAAGVPATAVSDPTASGAAAADAGPLAAARKPVYPPGTAPGALQFHHLYETRYFGTQDADAPPAGNTFQERMDAASSWIDPDAATAPLPAAAGHWSAATDDATPPYMDGRESRHDHQYAGQNPLDVGAVPGPGPAGGHAASTVAAWSRVKAVVRHSWERVKS
jgi:hypothetical protein